MLTDERYKQLMKQVGMPNSCSLLVVLRQCAMEAAIAERSRVMEKYRNLYKNAKTPASEDVAGVVAEIDWGFHSLFNKSFQPDAYCVGNVGPDCDICKRDKQYCGHYR